jgi:hypothetical protein
LLSQILRDLEQAVRDGRLKPVVIGPYEVDIPGGASAPGQGGQGGQGQTQSPGGDILGKILREALGRALGQGSAKPAALTNGAGAAVFGDSLEPGRDVEQAEVASLLEIFERFGGGAPRR